MTKRPYILGGLALGVGYFQAMLRRSKRSVSAELMKFRRREQMQRLNKFFKGERARSATQAASPAGQ